MLATPLAQDREFQRDWRATGAPFLGQQRAATQLRHRTNPDAPNNAAIRF